MIKYLNYIIFLFIINFLIFFSNENFFNKGLKFIKIKNMKMQIYV
jgi:hypothetical protein